MKKNELIKELKELIEYSEDAYCSLSDLRENLICLTKEVEAATFEPTQTYNVKIEAEYIEDVEAYSREEAVEKLIRKILEDNLGYAVANVYEKDSDWRDGDTYYLDGTGIIARKCDPRECDDDEE